MSAQTKFRQVFRTTCKRLTLLVLSFSSTFVATPANIPTSQSTARINNRSAVRVVNPLAVRFVRSCTFVCLKYPMYESINTSFPPVKPSHKGKPDISEVVPFWLPSVRTFQVINACWLVSRLPSVPYPFGLVLAFDYDLKHVPQICYVFIHAWIFNAPQTNNTLSVIIHLVSWAVFIRQKYQLCKCGNRSVFPRAVELTTIAPNLKQHENKKKNSLQA